MNKLVKLLHTDRMIERAIFRQRADFLTHLAMTSERKAVTSEPYDGHEVVVSLTTYGRRLIDAWLTIESLMQQTMRPNHIVLWLEHELQDLEPEMMKRQQQRGLEIRYCDNLRSYKKLLPALSAFPDAVIITFDDDVLYYPDVVENLYRSYREDPSAVHAMRMHRITLDRNGRPLPYRKWTRCSGPTEPHPANIPVGCGGVLYPPGTFDDEIFSRDIYTELAPHADDLWFKAMSLRRGVMCRKALSHTPMGEDYISNPDIQDRAGLAAYNIAAGGNDEQLRRLIAHYDLLPRLTGAR